MAGWITSISTHSQTDASGCNEANIENSAKKYWLGKRYED